MSDYLKIAEEVARKAGAFLLQNRGGIDPQKVDAKGKNDFVTHVDRDSEKMIVEEILGHFPNHQILAEEGSKSREKSEYRWIIDPLDGTKNFIQDIPFFTVSIALQKRQEMVAGVIYDPVHDELFAAEKGAGATRNGRTIHVDNADFSLSLIATGFPHKAKRNLPSYLLAFEEIFLGCSGMRRCGSAALDLCYTAMGRFAGFWEMGLSIWDVAAGSLIVREAGGAVTDFWGGAGYLESGFVAAGNAAAHGELVRILSHHFSHKK